MAVANAPSDQMYYADLIRDTAMLSPAAFGAWVRFLAMTWFTAPRGWFKGDLVAFARMFGSTTDQAEALIREILRYRVGSLGTETGGVRDFSDDWDGDAITDCHGNVTLVNRRKFREWKEQEAARIRKRRQRGSDEDGDAEPLSRECHSDVTPLSSSSISFSTSDLKRLIDACVREHADKDARRVEIAVIETMMRRKGSANEGKPVKSVRYFHDEIVNMCSGKGGKALGENAVDAMLQRRRQQANLLETAGPS